MLTPAKFVENYAVIGAGKTKSPIWKLLLLSILAGFFIGMGGAVTNTASHMIANVSAAKLISGILFPFGLIMVIFTGSELFTGNCLITISVLERHTSWLGMLRNLIVVYVGNWLGAMGLAAACVCAGQLDLSGGALVEWTIRVAAAKCTLPFGQAVLLGVLCNILVCTGVMCALCGQSGAGRAIGAFVPVSFFVICGFEHCVANMYYIPAGLFAQQAYGQTVAELTWSNFLVRNLLPVTIGNILGGFGFAAVIWLSHRCMNEVRVETCLMPPEKKK